MFGSLVNAGTIVGGGLLGLGLKREPSARQQLFLKSLLAFLATFLGFRLVWLALGGSPGAVLLQLASLILALVLGNLLGRTLGLQGALNRLGRHARTCLERTDDPARRRAGDGLVTGAILFAATPLAVLGALQEGLRGDPIPLLLKAVLDAMAAFSLVRVLGSGIVLAAIPTLAFQGTLTLLSRAAVHALPNPALHGFSAMTGLLLATVSLVILDVRKVPLADYLPALVLAPLFWIWLR